MLANCFPYMYNNHIFKGASESDLISIQNFLDICYKRRFIT